MLNDFGREVRFFLFFVMFFRSGSVIFRLNRKIAKLQISCEAVITNQSTIITKKLLLIVFSACGGTRTDTNSTFDSLHSRPRESWERVHCLWHHNYNNGRAGTDVADCQALTRHMTYIITLFK